MLRNNKILGHQVIATVKLNDNDILKDKNALYNIFDNATKNLTVLSHSIYKFPGNESGITGFILLAESHIAYHSWPEYNTLTIDVFTCSTKELTIEAFENIIKALNIKEFIYQYNARTTVD